MDFITQQGVDHYKDRLYIHWDVTTLCEYSCSYCYARHQYQDQWGKLGNWERHQYIIDEMSKSTLPIFLGLLGGEPTSHQRYFKLIELINEKVLHHEDSRLYITTNGAKPTEFYNRHPQSNGKVYFLWSIHPEYVDIDGFENIYNNIVAMHNKGYKIKVNLMLHPAKQYWESTKYMYERLSKLDYCILHPHFIYFGINADVRYSKDFYEFFHFLEHQKIKEFEFYTTDKKFIFSDYEIFKNGYNQFKDWKCYHNNFEILLDGRITDQCFNRQGQQIPKDFFKNIKSIEPKICPHNFCSCDGLLKIRKEK